MRSHLVFTTYLLSSFVSVTICVGSICWNHEGQKVPSVASLRSAATKKLDTDLHRLTLFKKFSL